MSAETLTTRFADRCYRTCQACETIASLSAVARIARAVAGTVLAKRMAALATTRLRGRARADKRVGRNPDRHRSKYSVAAGPCYRELWQLSMV